MTAAILLALLAGSTPAIEAEAAATFQRAEQLFETGRFREALDGYIATYDLFPSPALLFNIAQCHRNLGHRSQAVFFYRRYLNEAPLPKYVEEIEQFIAQLEAELAAVPTATVATATVAPVIVPVWGGSADLHLSLARVEAREVATPVYETWWFWTVIGVVVAGAATGTALAIRAADEPDIPESSLGQVWDER